MIWGCFAGDWEVFGGWFSDVAFAVCGSCGIEGLGWGGVGRG